MLVPILFFGTPHNQCAEILGIGRVLIICLSRRFTDRTCCPLRRSPYSFLFLRIQVSSSLSAVPASWFRFLGLSLRGRSGAFVIIRHCNPVETRTFLLQDPWLHRIRSAPAWRKYSMNRKIDQAKRADKTSIERRLKVVTTHCGRGGWVRSWSRYMVCNE